MTYENFNNEKDAAMYLYGITNHLYSFAAGSERTWNNPNKVEHSKGEPFYQLMPHTNDDGFFNWYCYVRPDNQFFKTKEMCVIHFIGYWTEWTKKGKPSWETESSKQVAV